MQRQRSQAPSVTAPSPNRVPFLMYGMLLACLGLTMYLFGVLIALPRRLLAGERLLNVNEWIVWYSGVPLMLGLFLGLLDLAFLFKHKRSPRREVRHEPVANSRLVVAL